MIAFLGLPAGLSLPYQNLFNNARAATAIPDYSSIAAASSSVDVADWPDVAAELIPLDLKVEVKRVGSELRRMRAAYQTAPDYGAISSAVWYACLLYTSPSPRDGLLSRMPSSA